jgi:hypothetical protein
MLSRIHPGLTTFADERCGMLAQLIAYVGALSLVASYGTNCLKKQRPARSSGTRSRSPGRPSLARRAEIPLRIAKCCLASQAFPKTPDCAARFDGAACQDAGFHATFSLHAALCDAVWPN